MDLLTGQKLRVGLAENPQCELTKLLTVFRYGGPAPRVAGSMVLSLQRMKRILKVDEKLAYVVVEPGVTFFDVYNHLVENKIDLWVSTPALGWGSVVGNVSASSFLNLLFAAKSCPDPGPWPWLHYLGRSPTLHWEHGGRSGFGRSPPDWTVGCARFPKRTCLS